MPAELHIDRTETDSTPIIPELIPPDDARRYMGRSVRYLLQEDEGIKEERAAKKEQLLKLSLRVLKMHGREIPVELDSPLGNSEKINTFRRETPIVPFQINEDLSIGVSLNDEVFAYVVPPNGEAVGVNHVHLVAHSLDTGDQIGRKSAAFLGAGKDFAYNAMSAKAEINDLNAIIGVVEYIYNVLSAESGSLQEPPQS